MTNEANELVTEPTPIDLITDAAPVPANPTPDVDPEPVSVQGTILSPAEVQEADGSVYDGDEIDEDYSVEEEDNDEYDVEDDYDPEAELFGQIEPADSPNGGI